MRCGPECRRPLRRAWRRSPCLSGGVGGGRRGRTRGGACLVESGDGRARPLEKVGPPVGGVPVLVLAAAADGAVAVLRAQVAAVLVGLTVLLVVVVGVLVAAAVFRERVDLDAGVLEAQQQLRVVAFGAEPDAGEHLLGGLAVQWTDVEGLPGDGFGGVD